MRRRILARLLAIGCFGGAALLAMGGSADALAPSDTGYWVKSGNAPPNVPPGGLFVGNDPGSVTNPGSSVTIPTPPPTTPGPTATGYTGVSAVRITGVSTTESATLTLVVAPGSVLPNPSVSTIVACPIVGTWQPPPGGVGDMSDAPRTDCSVPSVGKIAADNSSISFLLPASFEGSPGEFDVELLPGNTSPAPFEVAFDQPGDSSVLAASGGPVMTTVPAPPTTEPLFTHPELAVPSAVNIVAPGGPTPTAPVASPTTVALRLVPKRTAVAPPAFRGAHAHRLMAVVLLLTLGACLAWFGRQEVRAPRRLGALADAAGVS